MQTSLNVYTKPKSQTEREKMNSTGLLLQKKILSSPSSSACSSIESVYCNITTILLSSSQLEGWRGMMLCYNIWEIMGLNCIFGNIRVINYLLYLHTLTISSAQFLWDDATKVKELSDRWVSSVVVWWCMQFSMPLLRLCIIFIYAQHHQKEDESIHPIYPQYWQ